MACKVWHIHALECDCTTVINSAHHLAEAARGAVRSVNLNPETRSMYPGSLNTFSPSYHLFKLLDITVSEWDTQDEYL